MISKDCNKFVSNPGSPIHDLYAPKVKKDGTIEVVKVGEENLDAFIQSHKESTDISFILAKLANGDDSALKARVGFYGDFTNIPKTYAEVLQMQIDAGRVFEALPVEIKKKFDNDVNKFMAAAGSEEWMDHMKEYYPDYKSEVQVTQDMIEETND